MICAIYNNNYKIRKIKEELNNINVNIDIINYKFFDKNFTKFDIQNTLFKNKINVPKLFNFKNKTYKYNFPLYIKTFNNGSELNFLINNITELDFYIKNKFKNLPFYLEKTIISTENNICYKNKYFFINKKIFTKSEENFDKKLSKRFEQISNILNLDVFSADIIFCKNNYFIIDINSASGFFLSNLARNEFINYILKKQSIKNNTKL